MHCRPVGNRTEKTQQLGEEAISQVRQEVGKVDNWRSQPETEFMASIFGVPYRDNSLYDSVSGISLTTALFTELDDIAKRYRYSAFSVRLKIIFRLRFGFENGHFHTLQEIGDYFNVTRERIRQYVDRGFRCLRTSPRLKRLRPFIK